MTIVIPDLDQTSAKSVVLTKDTLRLSCSGKIVYDDVSARTTIVRAVKISIDNQTISVPLKDLLSAVTCLNS